MSLTKLFNLKFFIQNIKKSRSGIIFAMIILPIFTLLTMLLFSSDNTSMVMDYTTLSVFNILFMYIVPIVLSISLFNYVFKKNSCDFVGSMPLSRKTIFITNTIGGIAIIALIQIITAILVFLTSVVIGNLIVFGSMIWDILIYFTIAYVFVFVVCNLAMSFSGNMFATIAATMLILFFVPFLLFASRASSNLRAYSYYNQLNADDSNNIVFYEQFNFTAPSVFMDCIANNVDYEYNNTSIIKMLILSAVYFIIGLQLFKRKKFEMADESYENDNVHLIIKFLTLAPFFAIGVEGEVINNPISFVFFFAVVATYYFLFDIITKKKINIIKSIISFFVFSAMMYAIFALIVPNLDFLIRKKISIDDIKSVTIESISTYQGNSILTDLEIKDENLIYGMLANQGTTDDYYSGFNSVDLAIKTKNGDKYRINRADIPNFKKIIEVYGDEKYILNIKDSKIYLGGTFLTKEEDKEIRDAIKKDLDGISYKDLYEIINGDREIYSLISTSYINHKTTYNNFNASELNNTFDTTIRILNKSAFKHSTVYDFVNMTYMPDFENYIIKMNPNIDFESAYRQAIAYSDTIEYEDIISSGEAYEYESGEQNDYFDTFDKEYAISEIIFDGLRNMDKDILREYLIEHKDDAFDKTKPYFTLWFVTTDGGFYSNDIEGFYKILVKAFNENASEHYGIKLNEI